MKSKAIELERLEAVLSLSEGEMVLVRFLVFGTVELNVWGKLDMAYDPVTDEPFFRVINQNPVCSVLFLIKDVSQISKDQTGLSIILKKRNEVKDQEAADL